MILSKKVIIKWNARNIGWYKNKGYIYTKIGDEFEVKVEDLTNGSSAKVNVECDGCNEVLRNIQWQNYLKCVKGEGKYYCNRCANNGFKKWISFKQWCVENNKQNILNRWDYELNNCKPNEISYGVRKKFYFKCPKGIHKSELKLINSFTSGQDEFMSCRQCNSFAQWGTDNLGEDFLDKYWDYEKNTVDPWSISRGSKKNIWFKCQKNDYHGSYKISINSFAQGNNRCPYCNKNGGKIHRLDSLGNSYPEVLKLWSDKNKKSPYEYSHMSNKDAWWKCPEKIHKDFKRRIAVSNICDFRCPECQFSKGEKKIESWLISNNIFYESQKEFSNLVGLGGGNLSYDFYLPQYNILIEYQGEQHEKYIPGFHKNYDDFLKQIEHDKRKKEYALNHNINLLEIWYWDYDNIEDILKEKLLLKGKVING